MSLTLIAKCKDQKALIAELEAVIEEVRKLQAAGCRVICGRDHAPDNTDVNYVVLAEDLVPLFEALRRLDEREGQES